MATRTFRRRTRVASILTGLCSVIALLAILPASPASAQSLLTVNGTGDGRDANPGDGNCRTASGNCTLRAAIEEANASRGPDTITFAIPGSGVKKINIGSTLVLNDRSGGTTIDGYTQTGAQKNTHATQSNAKIMIEITTTALPERMMLIESAENTLTGLAIHGNGTRIELLGEDADGNRIVGNFIGTDPTATAISSSSSNASNAGVLLNLGPDRNEIGGPDRADRNVIARNGARGIRINHGETSENVVENNIIGMTGDMSQGGNQTIGIDLQWWTWGNYITDNLLSGNDWYGIDLSHSAMDNTVVDNRLGTGPGGNGGNAETANNIGIALKDNPIGNVVARNIIANSDGVGIWGKHDNNGANIFLDNRIGVGSRGASVGNGGYGLLLRGHDEIILNNIFGHNEDGAVYVTDTTNGGTRFPREKTERNLIGQNTYYSMTDPFIDIESAGQNPNDSGDGDDGAHLLLNWPTVTGVGPGEIYGNTCANCTVDVYVSGVVQGNGTLEVNTTNRGTGAGWIGRAQANGRGRFSLASALLRAGKAVRLAAVDAQLNTSEFSPSTRVPGSFSGNGSGANASIGPWEAPTVPQRPAPYVSSTFSCQSQGGVVSWDDADVAEYYVFFTVDGAERYVGPVRGTSVNAPAADSYRVEHWADGFATNAECPGDGVAAFSCSFQAGALSWSDVGATEYYAFATIGGTESYIGAVRGTSVSAPAASSYRVEHWLFGSVTNATCQR